MDKLNLFDTSTEALIGYVVKELEKSLDVNKGKVQPTDKTQSAVKKGIQSFYNSNQYRNSIARYLKDLEAFDRVKVAEYAKQGMTLSGTNITEAQRIAVAEHISYLNESGINERFNQPLRKVIFQNIRLGKSLSEIKAELSKFAEFKTNQQYFQQTAQQGADAYTSIVDQKIMDKYESRITGLRIVGTVIETSEPQCREAVSMGRELTIKEWNTLLKKYSDKIIPGTTIKNLMTNKLHHGCRHTFTPYF